MYERREVFGPDYNSYTNMNTNNLCYAITGPNTHPLIDVLMQEACDLPRENRVLYSWVKEQIKSVRNMMDVLTTIMDSRVAGILARLVIPDIKEDGTLTGMENEWKNSVGAFGRTGK